MYAKDNSSRKYFSGLCKWRAGYYFVFTDDKKCLRKVWCCFEKTQTLCVHGNWSFKMWPCMSLCKRGKNPIPQRNGDYPWQWFWQARHELDTLTMLWQEHSLLRYTFSTVESVGEKVPITSKVKNIIGYRLLYDELQGKVDSIEHSTWCTLLKWTPIFCSM